MTGSTTGPTTGSSHPAERIARALGHELAQGGETARRAFQVGGLLPGAVAYPETPEQTAALLELASGEGWGVLPWGGGSGMGRGAPPERYDLALSLSRLAQSIDHDVENLTLTGESGLTLAAANRQIGANHQVLALGFSGATHTLGGLIAANPLAPKRLLYGDVRDQLLGLRVALPDGRLVRYGRKVLKNVAGYDMNKLFLGSQGMLGVIVEAIFKLYSLPDEERYLLASFPAIAEGLASAAAFYASQLLPACLFLLSGEAAAHAYGSLHREAPPGRIHLLVGFEGRQMALRRQLADARSLMESKGSAAQLELDTINEGLRALLDPPSRSAPPSTLPPADSTIAIDGGKPATRTTPLRLRAGVKQSLLPIALERMEALAQMESRAKMKDRAAESGEGAGWVADYGAGQVTLSLKDPAPEALASLAEGIALLRKELAAGGGFLVVEEAPPALGEIVSPFGMDSGVRDMMRRLKSRFDPKDVMAPGRFLPSAAPARDTTENRPGKTGAGA